MAARNPLRTSREIYDQIRWDARLDDTRVLIGYEARGKGLEELPFPEFVPEGEIPWHRVWYFRGPDGLLWDRKERIDRLRTLPADPVPPQASSLTPLPSFHFREGAWRVAPPVVASSSEQKTFTVLTWNVLFDLFDGEKLAPAARQARLLEQLQARQPDVIALQEVTPGLVAALAALPWVQDRYTLTESPAAEGVTPYGVMLLSRIPLARVGEHRFTRDKRILVAELALAVSPVAVAVVHFTSDRAQNGGAIRGRERHVLLDVVMNAPEWSGQDWLVLGDVNYHRFDGNEPDPFARGRLLDVWASLRERDAGYTFDPARNTFARCTSSSGDRRRLDRVFLRKDHGAWAARRIELVGETDAPSDHFGLLCELGPDTTRERPVHTSALVLIPPERAWPQIQALRERHDRHAACWMPHLTLLYGFVPAASFPEATAVLARLLAARRPFPIRFRTLHAFASGVIYAEPDPSAELLELQSALEAEFPLCQEQSAQGANGFTPHLTLGQVAPEEIAATLETWQAAWVPFEMEVRTLTLLAREHAGVFAARGTVSLGMPQLELPAEPETVPPLSPLLAEWVGWQIDPAFFSTVRGLILRWAKARNIASAALGYPSADDLGRVLADAFEHADSDALRSEASMVAHVFARYAAGAWPLQKPFSSWSVRAALLDELQRAGVGFNLATPDLDALLEELPAAARTLEISTANGVSEALWRELPALVAALEKDPLLRLRPRDDGGQPRLDFEGELATDVLGAFQTRLRAELGLEVLFTLGRS